jgi:hypothetical protein
MKWLDGPRLLTRTSLSGAFAVITLTFGIFTAHASAAVSGPPMLRPVAQCVGVPEVTEWRGRFGRLNVAEGYNYYCGPTYAYSPEWFAAHVTVHPEWYTVYEEEPTTCVTYHFLYENRWYCYTGP